MESLTVWAISAASSLLRPTANTGVPSRRSSSSTVSSVLASRTVCTASHSSCLPNGMSTSVVNRLNTVCTAAMPPMVMGRAKASAPTHTRTVR